MWVLLLMAFFAPLEPTSFTEGKEHKPGFFDLYWDGSEGRLFLAVEDFELPFLFISSQVTGLGSNDIGLDRGKLGNGVLVHFKRVGNRVFLIQPNLTYRAQSDNPDERRAVEESFAYATLWSGKIEAEQDGTVFVDLSSLAFSDRLGIGETLVRRGEGGYKLDRDRSYYFLPNTKAFPHNTEVEVALTFVGTPKGQEVASVSADPSAPTIRHRHSFIKLPEPGYEKRASHPKAGGFDMLWRDYAAPLDEDLDQLWLNRHRLTLKNPKSDDGEVVEPIIYYVDRGAPPLIRDALVEGASWWAQAFEAAGLKNAFRVEVMPEGLDPLDVRYNVIQWVHRSTRGWSYGSSVVDPRTGEIIKGHVSLGSLRVRQDRLIFEGMLARDASGHFPEGADPVALALARIRQLSAHEVGHTLGLAHNFAASGQGRTSVMDYPAPLVRLVDGRLDTSDVYDRGIGAWDKVTIRCHYAFFDKPEVEMARILAEAEAQGLRFIGDFDSRGGGGMHPDSHLWDNGADPLDEMARVMELRTWLLTHFGPQHLGGDKVLARLEEVLVPVYLHHRFQIQAAVKSLGGASYDYGFNDGEDHYQVVAPERQRRALALMLATLEPQFLDPPAQLRDLIPPRPPGYGSHRELFDKRTQPGFDLLALPETSVQMTLDLLLHPARLNRLFNQKVNDDGQVGVEDLLSAFRARYQARPTGRVGVIHRQVNHLVLNHLISLVGETNLREEVRARLYYTLTDLAEQFEKPAGDPVYGAHETWLLQRLKHMDPKLFGPTRKLKVPPGSPI